MTSVQIGSADLAPSSLRSRPSSKPTQTTHSKFEVKPANQPSRDVPVLPAAGRSKPRAGGCSALQNVFHQADHQVRNAGIEHALLGRPGNRDDALTRADAGHKHRLDGAWAS